MYPPAHLAASLLLSEACRGDRPSALAATIVPDLVDKTLAWVMGVTPSARYTAHSLAAVALSTGLVAVLGGRRRGLSFGASYLTHLVCDLWEGGHVPWLMPFKRYEPVADRWRLGISTRGLLLELASILLLIRFALASPARSAQDASSPTQPSSTEAAFR
ncbi:MAG: metal-dependent hydrolase [Dehalococcoidia bacterium]